MLVPGAMAAMLADNVMNTPAEVAEAVGYLVGEDAGAVNGQSIIIDGGDFQQ